MTRKTILGALVLLLAGAGPALANDGAKLLDDTLAKAMSSNNIDVASALYAKDAVLYPVDGDAVQGHDAIRQYLANFLSSYTVQGYEFSNTQYFSMGRLSVGWGTLTLHALPKKTGRQLNLICRFTSVARNDNGYWFYIVSHWSVPQPTLMSNP